MRATRHARIRKALQTGTILTDPPDLQANHPAAQPDGSRTFSRTLSGESDEHRSVSLEGVRTGHGWTAPDKNVARATSCPPVRVSWTRTRSSSVRYAQTLRSSAMDAYEPAGVRHSFLVFQAQLGVVPLPASELERRARLAGWPSPEDLDIASDVVTGHDGPYQRPALLQHGAQEEPDREQDHEYEEEFERTEVEGHLTSVALLCDRTRRRAPQQRWSSALRARSALNGVRRFAGHRLSFRDPARPSSDWGREPRSGETRTGLSGSAVLVWARHVRRPRGVARTC